jgi:hypothetical protein
MNKVMGIAAVLMVYSGAGAGVQEDEFIRLAKSGLDQSVLISYIDAAKGPYHLTADQVIQLKDLGVSSSVISEALKHDLSAASVVAESAGAVGTTKEPPVTADKPAAKDTAAAKPAPAQVSAATPPSPPVYVYPDYYYGPYYGYWPYPVVGGIWIGGHWGHGWGHGWRR